MDADILFKLDNDIETISNEIICQVGQQRHFSSMTSYVKLCIPTADHIDLQAIQENDPITSFWKQRLESGKKSSRN